MESYSALLERLRAPQPSFQRFAVISVFEKLRSSPSHLSADSDPGREAISQCLLSSSSRVVDQSVRELCRLVVDSKMDLSRGFLELQSALEGCNSRLVPLFVKAIGLLVRFGFEKNPNFRFDSTETHPLVQVLLCRSEVQSELVQQVVLFIVESKRFGMAEVCEFLKPFLNFSVLRLPFSDSQSYSFVKDLISSMLSLCCSFPLDAMPLFKLLVQCLRYFPRKNDEDYRNFVYLGEYMVNSYIVILTQMVANGSMLIEEAQRCSVGLLETFLSPSLDICRHSGVSEAAVELSKCLLVAQKELHLPYMDETLSVALCLFFLLIQSELEHEQLSILKFLLFLLKWKSANENIVRYGFQLSEEVLLILPVISLVSSPSTSVKGVATEILFMLEKCFQNMLTTPKAELVPRQEFPELGRLESVIFNLLQHLWFQGQLSKSSYFFSTFVSAGRTDDKEIYQCPKAWVPQLKEYTLWIVGRRKSSQPVSRSQEVFSTEMPLLLGSIAGALVMHPSMGKYAADSLAAIGVMEPKLGPTLLLAILFYNNSFSNKDNKHPDMSLKCLAMLPSLASHSAMIPLVVQTILPMLHKDAKPVLYATATRLLCKTWEINDRAFGSLQGILHPKWFAKFMSERNICVSIAASIRDVCRNNPDRGVDLILSVSACIESHDATIQALGFQSLAHLCDADVIDFYTAWDVIAKNVVGYSVDPLVASSVCLLLRWGAMDAEAYSEALRNVLHILGQIGASEHHKQAPLWAKARASAFEALSHFEVFHIENCIPDLKSKSMELIVTETNPEVLEAVEGFVVKMMMHEHINRRRLVKEKRVAGNKIEKLLGVLPRVVFSTGRNQSARELPGAALLCLSFTPKDVNNQGASKAFQTVHSSYESALLEVAASLQLSRNILVALLSLQSWKPFMQRWMKAILLYLDTKVSPAALDKTLKAANDILKSLGRIAEESVPSSAENIAFAIGALCAVLPPSAHAVKASSSKLLLSWLFQYEHEYRQWSAAISLGLISSCLHVTDHKQKFENINGLVEVLCGSKSTFVRGACGVGLGFCCQDLLTRAGAAEDSKLDLESYKMQELELLGKIVRTLSLMICRLTQCSPDFLQSIAACFPMCTHDLDTESSCKSWEDLEDDIWGISGLVLGLGNSIGAIYRAGMPDAVIKVKSLIISWFLCMNHSVQRTGSESNERVLSVGSSLVLPTVVACCRRVELMDDDELDHLLNGYKELISELVSVKKSGIFHQSLLMSSSAGAGNLLACILNEGVHSLKVEDVKSLVDLFRKGYSSLHPPSIHLGGMLGVVNALGAGAGTLVHMHYQSASLHPSYEQMESSYVIGPLLSSPACEPHLTSMMQEIFLVAQYSEDRQLQQHAAWAVLFLRHHLRSKDIPNFGSGSKTDAAASQPVSQCHSDDSTVMKLSLWLMNHSATGDFPNIDTAATVLRCLSRAPRLPTMDWGTIIRRCMRYGSQSAELLVHKKGTLREECVRFSSAHANRFDALLSFLDELSDLPRFRLLELTLQSCLLVHLGVLNKVFSGSRLEKLLNDTASYFSSLLSNCRGYSLNQKSLLRVSCWKGLYQCLDEAPLDSIDYMSQIRKCIEVLFFSLPDVHSAAELGVDQVNSAEEWSNAVRCLGKAPQDLLSDLLQVDLAQGDGQIVEVAKKIQAKARLVRIGSIPLTDLRRLKSYILNIDSHVIWDVLVEVVAVLQPEKGSIKRQWLADAVEICCVTHFPSTALLFLGLLSGSFCKYMPLLILDQPSVLSNLPVTLTSLLSEPSWEVIAESVVSHLWASTRRIYSWATHSDFGDNLSDVQTIDESENGAAFFLLRVLHHTCFLLRDYLPLEKQLWLANVVIP